MTENVCVKTTLWIGRLCVENSWGYRLGEEEECASLSGQHALWHLFKNVPKPYLDWRFLGAKALWPDKRQCGYGKCFYPA